jgi:formyl-CoA transferase
VTFPGTVPRFEAGAGTTRWMGPELGEHTDEVLAELGLDAPAIAALRERGVI